MTHDEEGPQLSEPLQLILEQGLSGLPQAITVLVNEAMQIERSRVLHAQPYERTEARLGYANGFKPKTVSSRLGKLTLQVPQVRGDVSFYPSALERGERSERAVKVSLAEMYVQGVSTRRVKEVMVALCGTEVSSSQVSRAAAALDEELTKWRNRPLGETPFVILDALYEKVRQDGTVRDCAVLIATGVRDDGKRSVLGLSVKLSEAEVHWRDFLHDLKARGLAGVRQFTSDDHEGIKAGLKATFSGVPWQRCQVHLQRNAQAYVPKIELRAQVAADIRAIFRAPSRPEAERLLERTVAQYQATASRLAAWLETNLPEGFTVFQLPEPLRRRLATTNANENLNKQFRRRTRVVGLFPNEASLLRLGSAVLNEISDDWEAGKVYLNPNGA